jgi:CubicO group peptidase (beta-lactamase class C family)
MQHQALGFLITELWPIITTWSWRNALAGCRSRVCTQTLVFELGQGWGYSNVGYDFVRELLEKTAGRRWAMPLWHLVFEPPGTVDASIASVPANLDPTAWRNVRCYHPGLGISLAAYWHRCLLRARPSKTSPRWSDISIWTSYRSRVVAARLKA